MRVLLADDSALGRRLVEATLSRAGHDVTSVADGEEAVAAFARLSPPLVILDWLMPNVDGVEACRRIRALPGGADAFVLMITARDQSADLVDALGAGVDDYMMKPVTPDMLAARVIIAERRLEQNVLRRRAEEALAAAQRLAGIGETTLALQHEINNPLAALLVHAQLLVTEAATPALKADLDIVVELTRRIADVVRRLSELEAPRSVQYLGASSMIDLSTVKS
jgi:two-component system sensor histidine kinase/response regulator